MTAFDDPKGVRIMRGFTIMRSGSRYTVKPKVDRFQARPKRQPQPPETSGTQYLKAILGMSPDPDRLFGGRVLTLTR